MGSIIGVAFVGRLLWDLGQLAHLPLFLAAVAFGTWIVVATAYLARRPRPLRRPRLARPQDSHARS